MIKMTSEIFSEKFNSSVDKMTSRQFYFILYKWY